MDFLFEKSETKRILRKSVKYVLVIWILFVGYGWFNKYMIDSFLKGGIFSWQPMRFIMREVAVYGIGWVGYHFVYKYLKQPLRIQYWLILAVLDVYCVIVAFFRFSVIDNAFMFKAYDQVLSLITSPLYFVFFLAYSLVFQMEEDQKSDK